MSTAPAAPKASVAARNQDKFSLERATFGGITFLTLHGTLNETFEGRKIAESIRTQKLVVSMRDVRRFASWGMSEWMDFLRINAARDLYLVECSPYALSQINLVTGLLGHAKLVSFYAGYRCGSCGEEREAPVLIPRDRAILRELPGSYQTCETCGGHARIEAYPAAFFDKIAERPPFDIDDEVLGLFRASLGYDLAPDLTRFRAFRKVHGGHTYLRLSGNLATLPSEALAMASVGTTVVDLASIIFDPAEVSAWRTYVQLALARLPSLQLLNCPPGFLESAVTVEDLRDRLKVRTFAMPYECLRCETTMAYLVDVAENLEQLVGGVAPAASCPHCQSQLIAVVSPEQMEFMRSLPARDRDVQLDKLLASVRDLPPEKLEDALVATPQQAPRASAGTRRIIFVAAAVTILFIGGLVGITVILRRQGTSNTGGTGQPTAVAGTQPPSTAPQPAKQEFERRDWILSDTPSSAYCHDMINRLMCVGVSAYRRTLDEATAEASDAALEELVNAVGLKISDSFFRESIIPGYSAVRAKALSAMSAEQDRGSAADVAEGVVTKARKRVAESLRASGGAAVPSQKSDWYWERYAAKAGGDEFLSFVRYDINLDAVKALVEKYSAATPVIGSTVMTAFPALAWQHSDFTGGALLAKLGHSLDGSGIAAQGVVTAVGDQRVNDAPAFAKRIEEWKQAAGDLKLTVKATDGPARAITIPRARVR
jgi:hypothetical protein